MNSIVSIVGFVLSGKKNYQEWFRKLKSSLVFNDLWEFFKEEQIKMEKKLHRSHLIMRSSMQFERQRKTRHMH